MSADFAHLPEDVRPIAALDAEARIAPIRAERWVQHAAVDRVLGYLHERLVQPPRRAFLQINEMPWWPSRIRPFDGPRRQRGGRQGTLLSSWLSARPYRDSGHGFSRSRGRFILSRSKARNGA
jgi:hypothetical protein